MDCWNPSRFKKWPAAHFISDGGVWEYLNVKVQARGWRIASAVVCREMVALQPGWSRGKEAR
jgi:hypothetical protein